MMFVSRRVTLVVLPHDEPMEEHHQPETKHCPHNRIVPTGTGDRDEENGQGAGQHHPPHHFRIVLLMTVHGEGVRK